MEMVKYLYFVFKAMCFYVFVFSLNNVIIYIDSEHLRNNIQFHTLDKKTTHFFGSRHSA